MKQNLQDLAMNVHDFCAGKQIQFTPVWISRESSPLVLADKFSQTLNNDDLENKPFIFLSVK